VKTVDGSMDMIQRVLLLAATTGYQTRAFGEAAERLGVELVFATDRCRQLEDPWADAAIPIRFHDEAASVEAIVEAARSRPFDGLLAVGDRPTVIAAGAAAALGLPWHPPGAAAIARKKQLSRPRLSDAGLPAPWFVPARIDADPAILARTLEYPCVIKPAALSGSRGVMRADDPGAFLAAFARLARLLRSHDVRAERDAAHDVILVEGFIPGREFAVEGVLDRGRLVPTAIFDKPDPLDGPFFEETIYVTPSGEPAAEQEAILRATAEAASAIGLFHGPIHAECRANEHGVFVLEVAARPIGGLCARVLRGTVKGTDCSYEEFLLRHAIGAPPDEWTRETRAAGVMMIPIPRRGIYRGVAGVDEARAVAGIDEIEITARLDQRLVPLPEGASYLGFIFARGARPADVVGALRAAHGTLTFTIEPELRVVAGIDETGA
jgi:biotin carboxylase